MSGVRFKDSGRWLPSFAAEFLIRCPRCSSAAFVRRDWDHETRRWRPATMTCAGCGFTRPGGAGAAQWAGPVLLCAKARCRECSRPMHLSRRAPAEPSHRTVSLRCDGCGAVRSAAFTTHPVRVPQALVDDCFGFPLLLQTPCAGHRLWAFNAAHLAYLKDYLQADLRERGNAPARSVASRLPGWLKQAKHRGEALRAVARLEDLACG